MNTLSLSPSSSTIPDATKYISFEISPAMYINSSGSNCPNDFSNLVSYQHSDFATLTSSRRTLTASRNFCPQPRNSGRLSKYLLAWINGKSIFSMIAIYTEIGSIEAHRNKSLACKYLTQLPFSGYVTLG